MVIYGLPIEKLRYNSNTEVFRITYKELSKIGIQDLEEYDQIVVQGKTRNITFHYGSSFGTTMYFIPKVVDTTAAYLIAISEEQV